MKASKEFAPNVDADAAEYLDVFRLTEAEFEYVRMSCSTSLIKRCTRPTLDPIRALGSLE